MLGVDRLDYTKGIPDRMRRLRPSAGAASPEHRGKVVLHADRGAESLPGGGVSRPSSARSTSWSASINGRFATAHWSPIRYLYRSFSHEERLAAIYREADVALVTPLRDGMNLVAKEFIACPGGEDPGVLILSRLAGAADTMRETLLVNPYDIEEHRATPSTARSPWSEDERASRITALRRREKRDDLDAWTLQSFVEAAASAHRAISCTRSTDAGLRGLAGRTF